MSYQDLPYALGPSSWQAPPLDCGCGKQPSYSLLGQSPWKPTASQSHHLSPLQGYITNTSLLKMATGSPVGGSGFDSSGSSTSCGCKPHPLRCERSSWSGTSINTSAGWGRMGQLSAKQSVRQSQHTIFLGNPIFSKTELCHLQHEVGREGGKAHSPKHRETQRDRE